MSLRMQLVLKGYYNKELTPWVLLNGKGMTIIRYN